MPTESEFAGLVAALVCGFARPLDFLLRCFFGLFRDELGFACGFGSGPTVMVSFEIDGEVFGLRPR